MQLNCQQRMLTSVLSSYLLEISNDAYTTLSLFWFWIADIGAGNPGMNKEKRFAVLIAVRKPERALQETNW